MGKVEYYRQFFLLSKNYIHPADTELSIFPNFIRKMKKEDVHVGA